MSLKRNNNIKKPSVAGGLQMNGKTIAAIVLVAVMALLWGRVLLKGKGGPATANAQDLQQQQLPGQANQPTAKSDTIVTMKLDILEGRHDILTSDIFGTTNWKEFNLEGNNEASVDVSLGEDNLEKRHRANLEKLAKTLKLEAVIQGADGNPYQVFVNDAVLTVGSVLTVKEGSEQYELVLQDVKENEALFTWNETTITLKMTEMVEK